MIAIFIVNKRVKYRAIKIKTFVKQTYQSWNDEVVNLLSLVKGNLWFCGPLMCAVFTHIPTGQKDDKRKKRMEVGWIWSKDTTQRGKKKQEQEETKLESIMGFSLVTEEGRVSERRLRTANRILPSCRATWGQEGPPVEVTWPANHFLLGSAGIRG